MINERGKEEAGRPSIVDSLVEKTMEKFLVSDRAEDGGPNLLINAIDDSILRYGRDVNEIREELMKQATLNPDQRASLQELINELNPELTTEDRSMEISRRIVFMKTVELHPLADAEDTRRDQTYGSSPQT